jgi:hypothetical protein
VYKAVHRSFASDRNLYCLSLVYILTPDGHKDQIKGEGKCKGGIKIKIATGF